MPQLARRLNFYDQLQALPEGVTGEILCGQLYTQARPSGRHVYVTGKLDRSIGRYYDDGDGGPGGWWIFIEPEVHFMRDVEVAVPDLAGWRRERMPNIPEGHRFEVVPDWVCEILSPSTASKDREIKLPLYAHYGVAYAWLVDLKRHTLESYELVHGEWRLLTQAAEGEMVKVAPFGEMALDLAALWL